MTKRNVIRTLAATLLVIAVQPLHAQEPDPADAAWAAGDHGRARALYAQRVAADSTDVRALHRLGLLFAWEREYAQANALLEKVVRIAPSREARMDQANVLAWSGSYDRALDVLSELASQDPTAAVLHARARFLSWAARYGEAEAAYGTLLRSSPTDAEAVRGLARVTTWRGDLAAGERLWREALAAEPHNADAHVGLSQVLRWRGRAREALEHAEQAARLRPDDRDVIEQLAWAEAAFAPRFAPTFSAETDSDDNRLYTAAFSATVPASRRFTALVNGYLRRADGPVAPGVDAEPRSLAVLAGVRLEVGDGWTLTGTGGVTDASAVEPAAVYRAGIATPQWAPVTASVAVSRSVLDATADLMARGITTDEASVTAAARLTRSFSVDAGFGVTRFNGVLANDRVLGRLGVEARATSWLRLRPRMTAFIFEHNAHEGYFAPDEYGLAELGIGIDRHRGSWSFSGEAAPGMQRIGSQGDVKGALSARARVGYTVAPGREIGLAFTFSQLGIDGLAAGTTEYRYRAFVISGAWGF
ncbi:MAG TPA: tetratricopeptide repeat protein [Longimicrobiales bacterium]